MPEGPSPSCQGWSEPKAGFPLTRAEETWVGGLLGLLPGQRGVGEVTPSPGGYRFPNISLTGLARCAHRVTGTRSGAPLNSSSPHPTAMGVMTTVANIDHPFGTCQLDQNYSHP